MPIQFDNSNTGTITLASSATASYSLVFPAADGTSGQGFSNDGSGNLSFATTGTALAGWTSALNTAAPNATINVSSLTASGGTTNQSIAIVATNFGRFYIPDSGQTGGLNPGTGKRNWDFAGYNMRGGAGAYSVSGDYAVSAGFSSYMDSSCAYTVGVGGSVNYFNAAAQHGVSIGGIAPGRVGNFAVSTNNNGGYNNAEYATLFNGQGAGDNGVLHTYNFGSALYVGADSGYGSCVHGCVLGQTTNATPQILGTSGNVALASVDRTTCWSTLLPTSRKSVVNYHIYIMCYDYVNGDKAKMWEANGVFGVGNAGIITYNGAATLTNLFGDASLASASATVTLYAVGTFWVYYVTGTGVAATDLRWIAWTTQTNVAAS